MILFHQYSCPKWVILRPQRARQRCLFMCVLNVLKFTNGKLHPLHLDCFCFMWLAPSIQLTNKRVIMCLCRARHHCFSMCVLRGVNFTNVKLHSLYLNCCFFFMWLAPLIQLTKKEKFCFYAGQDNVLSSYMCIKCVHFCKIAFIAFELPLFHVVSSINTVAQKE